MTPSADAPPAWLFSFVDLAFLLLIAMTQLGGDEGGIALELGEIVVPRIGAGAATELPSGADARWQLRVHPPAVDGTTPFELSHPAGTQVASSAERVIASELPMRLADLHAAGEKRPLLAPHGDSRTQDLLDAVDALENVWPSRRRATVAPVFAGR